MSTTNGGGEDREADLPPPRERLPGPEEKEAILKHVEEQLAKGLLTLASIAGVPLSFWQTDHHILLACEVLGIDPTTAFGMDWESEEEE